MSAEPRTGEHVNRSGPSAKEYVRTHVGGSLGSLTCTGHLLSGHAVSPSSARASAAVARASRKALAAVASKVAAAATFVVPPP